LGRLFLQLFLLLKNGHCRVHKCVRLPCFAIHLVLPHTNNDVWLFFYEYVPFVGTLVFLLLARRGRLQRF